MKQTGRGVAALAIGIGASLFVLAGCQSPKTQTLEGSGPLETGMSGEPTPAGFEGAAAGNALFALQDRADQLADQLTLEKQQDRAGSKAAFEAAKKLVGEFRYLEAESKLREALRLDSSNAEARKELDRVLFILGDRSGAIRDLAREEAAAENVRRQQAEVELKRMLVDGQRLMDDDRYEEAAKTFDKVLETIQWFHFNVDLSEIETEARNKKVRADELARAAESDRQRLLQDAAREDAEAQRERSVRFLKNRVKSLMTRARSAYDRKDFDNVVDLTQRVIDEDRTHGAARSLQRKAKKLRRLYAITRTRIRTREEWDRTFLSQLESEIPYQKIFNFPPREEWLAISRKTISLADRIAGLETSQQREIKVKMRQPVDVGFDDQSFSDVIDFLHSISGINFVMTKEAREAVEDADEPVNLPAVTGLALENVLRLVLDTRDPKFAYVVGNGAVLIGPEASLEEELYLEFYEVSDITKSPPDFRAPELALAEGTEDGGGGGSILDLGDDEGSDATTLDSDILLSLIEQTLGGEEQEFPGSVKYQGGKLVARTTLESHQKIQKLLTALRKSTGIMVTVEARFIDLQDNFIEVIGVDMGNPFNSNLPNTINDIDGTGTQIATGFEFVDAQGQTDVRSAVFNAFSLPLGSSVAPFELTQRGGFALQYNVLDTYILEAILEANAKTQEFRKLDAPRVTAFNTQIAHSLVIEQAAYIRDAEVNQTGVIPVINPVIGILNSGSILEVRPTVSHDRKYIILEIRPTLATQLPSRFKRLTLGFTVLDVEFPVLSVTRVNTTVTIPDGGTVLVGGLKRTITQEAQIGVPWVSRLPILNLLFGRKGESRLQSNLFVLITAKITVIRDEERQEFN